MACFCLFGFFLLVGSLVSVYSDMKVDCEPDFVSLVWTETRPQVDTSLYRLGNCVPTTFTPTQAIFKVELNECKFTKLVAGDRMVYNTNLTYLSSSESQFVVFNQPVTCSYQRPKDWQPMIYSPVFETFGQGELVFHIGLLNNDLTESPESPIFPLGSIIPIVATVQQSSHQPLQLFIEECVAAASPKLLPNSQTYAVVSNKGCLMDSKLSRSKFIRRHASSEIILLLQAFRFSTSVDQVFLHCKLVAWDPSGHDKTKKACNYVQGQGWQLLDGPSYSNLCDCCDSNCNTRRTRSLSLGDGDMTYEAVLGPITIT